MENNPDNKPWTDFIYPILLTYNHKLKSSITGLTPNEANLMLQNIMLTWKAGQPEVLYLEQKKTSDFIKSPKYKKNNGYE